MSDLYEVRDQRTPGWHWIENEVIDVYGPRIGAYGCAVYMCIARHSDNATKRSLRSYKQIAAALGISHDSVARSVAKLVQFGLLRKEQPAPGGPCFFIMVPVKKAALAISTSSTDRTLTASPPDAHSVTPLTLTASTPTLTASPLTLTAYRNKEARLKQDSLKTKPSASAEAEADPRHAPIREYIKKRHAAAIEMPEEIVPWDGREGLALKKLLDKFPKLEVEQVKKCVHNRYMSAVNHAQRPAKWIPDLLEFWDSSLDEFGKPDWLKKKAL